MTLQCRATNLFSHCVFTLSAHHSSLLRVGLYSLCRPRIDFLILGRWSHFKVEVVLKQTWTPQNLTHVHTGKYYHKQWRELNVKKYCAYTSELETDINCCAFRYAVPTEIDSSFLSTLVDSYCWWVETKSLLQYLCTQRKQTFSHRYYMKLVQTVSRLGNQSTTRYEWTATLLTATDFFYFL